MTDSPRLDPTGSAAPLPPLPRHDSGDPVEFASFERRIDIGKRTVLLRPYANRNIVFNLSFDAIQSLADLTRGDDRWEEVG